MSGKLRWVATSVPDMRRALARTATAEAARAQGFAEQLRQLGDDGHSAGTIGHGAERFERHAADYQDEGARWARAELFWITPAMADIALDASTDCPALRPDHDAPAANGLCVFAKPLPPFPTRQIGGLTLRQATASGKPDVFEFDGDVPVDGLGWMLDSAAGTIDIVLLCRDHRLPHPMTPADPPLVGFMRAKVDVPTAFDGDPAADEAQADAGVYAIARLLSTIWVQMQIPTVADRTSLDGQWGGPATDRTRPDRLVTMVDLRPLRHVSIAESGEGRKLTRRHMVRGHWTHQPYGPGRSQRRLQWRAPYIKGPEGAPLVARERVNIWRR